MRRTEVLQGLPRMNFEDIYERWQQRRPDQAEAAEIQGERAHLPAVAGALRRRRARGPARPTARQGVGPRVPADQVHQVLTVCRERYGGSPLRTLLRATCLVFAPRMPRHQRPSK
jgi:hypothetical protein